MKLIVTEKPSVALQMGQALGVSNKGNGYIYNNEWTITWCVGHLITMSYPEKYDEKYEKWNIDDLPFLPKEYKYEVIPNVKEQYEVVKKLLQEASVIYNAGDSGREGEYIQRLVYTQAGVEGKKKILRVWIDSQTEDEIKRGIREAKPESAYDNLAKAASMRAIEDYAIGINLSRALSCKFGYEFNEEIESKDYVTIAVGRVMTCVLGMIVKRELEIMLFEPTDYYKIDAELKDGIKAHWKAVEGSRYYNSNVLYNENGFKDKSLTEKIINVLNNKPELKVESAETKTEKKSAPYLYSLSELQSDCTKRFKISPDETLSIAQSLYEKKMTTYPRTDARVLSTPVCKEIINNLNRLHKNGIMSQDCHKIIENGWYKGLESTRYCDDKKITDHYAIIPTGEVTEELSGLEKEVYDLIVKRFLSIFYPPAEYSKTSVTFIHSTGERFFATSKYLTKKGYFEVAGLPNEKTDDESESMNSILGTLKNGDICSSSFIMQTSTTQPPKRYTSGSMILSMENAGNLIEDEELRAQIKGAGIGTSATRAEVIKKLIKNNYIELNKKTQILKPTFIGSALYEIVDENVPSLLSPEMTASWEKGLAGIENGTISPEEYQKKLESFVIKTVENIKSKTAKERPVTPKNIAGKCPVCGEDLYETEKGYFCSKRRKDKKGCQFAFSKTIGRTPIPKEQIEKLLNGENTDIMEGLQGKSGTYSAYIEIKKNGECALTFPHDTTTLKCPKCGGEIIKGSYSYECKECKFSAYHTSFGHEITEEEFNTVSKNLILGPISDFKTKEGEQFSAYIVNTGNTFITIRATIAGRNISIPEIMMLLTEGHTGKLSGFKGKKGEFEAGLKLNNRGMVELVFLDEEGKVVKKSKKPKKK